MKSVQPHLVSAFCLDYLYTYAETTSRSCPIYVLIKVAAARPMFAFVALINYITPLIRLCTQKNARVLQIILSGFTKIPH